MNLVTPDFGLLFWMLLSFTILLFLLKKFAWKPIVDILKSRDESIEKAPLSAENAKKELEDLKREQERMRKEILVERDHLLSEAMVVKENIIEEAKHQAKAEADKIVQEGFMTLEHKKHQVLAELKNQVAELSITLVENVLTKTMADEVKQGEYIKELLNDITLN
jgi:F-type H+-transporting ATPase subunit b